MTNRFIETTKAIGSFLESKVAKPILLKMANACYRLADHTDLRSINSQITFDSPAINALGLEDSVITRLRYLSGQEFHYFPIYILGGNGTGKTIMLQCMANEVKKKYPLRRVAYMKANEFCDEMVSIIKEGKNAREIMSRRYKNFDALFIDDIQHLEAKINTAEMFMDIIDAYVNDEKMLVFAGDKVPNELPVTGRLKKHLTIVGVIPLKKTE